MLALFDKVVERIAWFISLNPVKFILGVLATVLAGMVMAKGGIVTSALTLVLGLVAVFLVIYGRHPQTGIYGIMVMGFLTAVLSRYFPFAPYGLLVDAFLVLTFLILLFRHWQDFDLSPAKNDLSLVWLLWLVFIVLMIANPLSRSVMAWFYAMRGFALYSALMVPLVFLIFKDRVDMERIFILIVLFEIAGTIWGIKQLFISVSPT